MRESITGSGKSVLASSQPHEDHFMLNLFSRFQPASKMKFFTLEFSGRQSFAVLESDKLSGDISYNDLIPSFPTNKVHGFQPPLNVDAISRRTKKKVQNDKQRQKKKECQPESFHKRHQWHQRGDRADGQKYQNQTFTGKDGTHFYKYSEVQLGNIIISGRARSWQPL